MYFFLKDIKEPPVEDIRDFAKRGAVRSSRFRWPISIDHDGNAVVRIRFRVDSGLDSKAESELKRAIQDIHAATCVRFLPRTGEPDYVSFETGSGCSSKIGKREGKQVIFLDAREDIMNKYPPGYMDNLGFSYDLESIMQYRKDAFAKSDDLVTMEARSDPNMVLGNMNAMSASDIMKINKLFNCAGKNEVCKYNTIHENMQNAMQCNAKCNAMQKYNAV
ncbi:hypothetical protein OS493_028568 [Desmophyllum pertusum]|uniref:Peptidase M12A domain-containing protein n=1 Tax=Desmophyllum pertusum TaxID=174260 RepID=A0A9W9YX24_9CNID|nr:hypothetical protein OS493_028568 [Desmophyllum pertusum]